MSNIQFTNFAVTTLASGINGSVTSLTVATGTGALFPTLAGAQYFYCVLADAATGVTREVIKVTARSTDTFTVTRAQEGTTGQTYAIGDKVELRLTAAGIATLATTETAQTFAGVQTFSSLINQAAGADIASAATIDLTTATGNSPRITGTVATSAVTMNTGQQVLVVANGAWPLTYNATTNKLNSAAASVTLAAGDMVLYSKDLSGIVHGNIIKADGTAVVAASGGVTSIVAGTGITVSGATGAVTVNTIVSAGGVGTYMNAFTTGSSTSPTRGSTYAGSTLGAFYISGCCAPFATFGFSGTWRAVSPTTLSGAPGSGSNYYQQSGLTTTLTGNTSYWMFQRTV
tara:strand:+ start:1484 stop:2518 length:1035 start_codon:yes stop_codon:yes gene_type:complete